MFPLHCLFHFQFDPPNSWHLNQRGERSGESLRVQQIESEISLTFPLGSLFPRETYCRYRRSLLSSKPKGRKFKLRMNHQMFSENLLQFLSSKVTRSDDKITLRLRGK